MLLGVFGKKLSFYGLFLSVAISILFVGFLFVHNIAQRQTALLFEETIQSHIKTLCQSGVKTITARLDSILSKAKGLKKLADHNGSNVFSDEATIRLMTGYIEGDPSLEACYLIDDLGNYLFLNLNRGLPNRKTFDEFFLPSVPHFDNSAAKNARYILKKIFHDPTHPSGYVEYRNDASDLVVKRDLNPSDFMFDELLNYDARMLPTFQKAKETRQFVWSNIYVYIKGFSTSRLGIAYMEPILDRSGKFWGVLGLDYNVKSFASVLRDCQVSPNALSFVVDHHGRIYGVPNEDDLYILSQESTLPNSLDHLKNPVMKIAFDHFMAHQLSDFKMEHDGKRYMACFIPFPAGYGNSLVYGVLVPEKDYLGKLEERDRIILILEALTVFIFLITLAVFVKWLTRPFQKLVHEMEMIQNFNIQESARITSPSREISLIADALEHMKSGLQAFGRFVPKALVRQLIAQGKTPTLGGEKRHLTVMFSDIRGFTTISDELPADLLNNHLSDYMNQLSHVIEEQKGTIDKFIGDAIMAFWGAPAMDLEHAQNACLALLQCRNKLRELNQIWKMQGKPEMFTRFGLSTGEVIVGNFGSEDRLNYTIIGSTVNLAARLEKLNKKYGTDILVSESVIHSVGSRFVFRPVDMVIVRGKTTSCMVYELMGETKDGAVCPVRDEDLVLKGLTELAYTLFRQGYWQKSLKSWQNIHKLFPHDPLAKIYSERCHAFIKNPPDDWDGVTRLGEEE